MPRHQDCGGRATRSCASDIGAADGSLFKVINPSADS
jgi:hypothetical protein